MLERIARKAKDHPWATKAIIAVTGVLIGAGITAAVIYTMNQDDDEIVDGEVVETQSDNTAA